MVGAKILIVEDQGILAEGLKNMLTGFGYQVSAVINSYEEALAETERSRPDLILMDNMLSNKMEGIAAAKTIQTQHNIPVIFLTENTDSRILQRAKLAEPSGYIVKPFDERDLRSTIEFSLYKRRIQSEYETRLQHRLAVEETVAQISNIFISAEEAELDTVLAKLGTTVETDQTCIFKIQENIPVVKRTARWCSPTSLSSGPENDELDPDLLQTWLASLKRNQIIDISDVLEMPSEARSENKLLEKQGIRAALLVPINNPHEKLLGFILLKNIETRNWPEQDVKAVRIIAEMIGSYWHRKNTEKALHQSEEKYRQLVENINDVIFSMDTQGKITYISPVIERKIGYKPEEVLGHNFTDFIHPEDLPVTVEGFKKIMHGEMKPREYRLLTKDRKIRWVISSSRPSYHNDKIIGLQGVITDITAKKQAEKTTQKTEEKYRRLVELSTDLIAVHCENKLVFINAAGMHLLGATDPQQVLGKFVFEFVHPDYLESIKERIRLINDAVGQTAPLVEEKFLRLDGSTVDVEVEAISFEYEGKPAVQVIARDISERKKTKLALQKQLLYANSLNRMAECVIGEDKLQVILEEMAIIVGETLQLDRCLIYDIDFDKHQAIGHCEYLNPQQSTVTPTKDTYTFDIFLSGATQMRHSRRLLESHADEIHPKLVTDGSAKILHKTMQSKSLLWYPFAFGPKGFFVLVFNQVMYRRIWQVEELDFTKSVAHEVSLAVTKMRYQEERWQAEEKYLTLFEESKDVVFISTPAGKFLDINPAGVELFGYQTKEALLEAEINKDLYVDSKEREKLKMALIEKGFVKDFPSMMKNKNNEILYVQETSSAIKDENGKIIAIRGIIHDITSRKKLEEQLMQARKMESVGTLAGGVAHDFNNLLTAILGNTAFGLQDTSTDEAVHQDFLEIQKAAEKASILTDQLLSFSRRKTIEKEVLNINETCEDIIKLIQRILGEDIDLSVKLAANLPNVLADSSQIQQVLMNLCANARDALPNGGKLTLETSEVDGDQIEFIEPAERKDRYVKILVADNGAGMNPETLSRIFEPFYTTKEVGKGTGLGMAVTYGIVQQHDGCIRVHSEIDVGTTFEIYLPETEIEVVKTAVEEIQMVIPLGQEKILVVEDDTTVRNVTVRILNSLDYDIVTAADCDEAMEVFSHQNIDLVLMDIVMPKQSGPEIYKKMIQQRPDLPVIFVTGYDVHAMIDELHAESLKSHVNILQKPYTREELGQMLRDVLDSTRVTRVSI